MGITMRAPGQSLSTDALGDFLPNLSPTERAATFYVLLSAKSPVFSTST
jgi:hypothetical protein